MKVVEVKNDEFEFYRNGKPTGHYMRGKVLQTLDIARKVKIISLSNGKTYIVDKKDCVEVS